MIWILGSIAGIILVITVFLLIPYSPTKNEFLRDVQRHTEKSIYNVQPDIFTEESIEHLPELIQNHFRAAGLIGRPISNSVKAFMPSTPFYQSRDTAPLSLDYTLYLFSHPAPVRLAYMTTSMYGIPFAAYDSTQDGVGFMRGVIAKVITLFNETGYEMDKGQLLTWLGEAPLLPSIFLSGYVTWETIDVNHVRATLNYMGMSVSGVYTFNDNGFIVSFHTNERARVATDGSTDFPEWSVILDEWVQTENGTYIPHTVKAVWHLDDGELVYFSASGFDIEYGD